MCNIPLGWDLPSGPVVKNPSCKAEDVDSVPGCGSKIPHATERQSPHTATTEPSSLKSLATARESMHCNVRSYMPQLDPNQPPKKVSMNV